MGRRVIQPLAASRLSNARSRKRLNDISPIRAPLAVAAIRRHRRRRVSPIQRTMFFRRLRLGVCRAPAAVERLAFNVPEQRLAAVRDPAADDAERAAFADGRAGRPADPHRQQPRPAELCRRRLRRRTAQRAKRAPAAGGKEAHDESYRTLEGDSLNGWKRRPRSNRGGGPPSPQSLPPWVLRTQEKEPTEASSVGLAQLTGRFRRRAKPFRGTEATRL